MLSSFPRGVLDEILNLIESVSEGFLPAPVFTISKLYQVSVAQHRNNMMPVFHNIEISCQCYIMSKQHHVSVTQYRNNIM